MKIILTKSTIAKVADVITPVSVGDIMEYDGNPKFRITKGLKKGVFCDDGEYGLDIDDLFEKKWKIVPQLKREISPQPKDN